MMSEYSLEEYIGDIYMIVNIDNSKLNNLKKYESKLSACTLIPAEEDASILKLNNVYIEESLLDYYSMDDILRMIEDKTEITLKTDVKDPYIGELVLSKKRKKHKYLYTLNH